MKKLISFMAAVAVIFTVIPQTLINAENMYLWTFDSESAVTTDATAKNIPIVNDTAQVADGGYVSLYNAHNMSIEFSEPIRIGEDDIVTVEADITYGSENQKYTVFSISSSSGTNDLLFSNLCRYTNTKYNSLKLGGIEKLTLRDDGTYSRPSFPATGSGNTANTKDGWLHYKAVYDYNMQTMTLTLSRTAGSTEYSAPLSYQTDIALIKFASDQGASRCSYVDNVSITTSKSDIPYTPGEKVMSITADAQGDSTTIDTSTLYRDSHVSEYMVYTADNAGNKLSETKVSADTVIIANTNGAKKAEVVPVFKYSDIGDARSEKTLRTELPNGLYNFTVKKEKTPRSDIFINGAMIANNVDKEGYNRKVSQGAQITVHDIVVDDGTVRIKTDDTTSDGGRISWCEFYKSPSISDRKQKVYIIGDSLVANYYGTYSNINKAQFGWGEVINKFFTDTVEVVNLANGGHYATILETTAFPGVVANAKEGDYLIIESGYNDLKHNTKSETQEAVERMVNTAKEKGIIPIVVSPNASMQEDSDADDYVESVRYTDAMAMAAKNTGALYINLSGESYNFYYDLYGDDRTVAKNTYYFPNEPDYLHHNYLGALNCARIVAQGMYNAGIGFINIGYSYTFTDTANNEITLRILGNETCDRIVAKYNEDGTLLSVKIEKINIDDIADVNNSALEKTFYWESIDNMKPVNTVKNTEKELDLSGTWQLSLSAHETADFNDTVQLPGTLSENEKGTKNNATDKTKLSLKYKYSGSAVYKRKIDIPDSWSDKSVTLLLERTKLTRVWVNGVEETDFNTNNSLAVPHEYHLKNLVAGTENTIEIEVKNGTGSNETKSDNVYGLFRTKTHMLTAETQTDWNGVIGKMELKATDKVYIEDVMVYPDTENKCAKVRAVVHNDTGLDCTGNITLQAKSYNHDGPVQIVPKQVYSADFESGTTTVEYIYPMGDNIKLWSEFHPSLYHMNVSLVTDNAEKDYCIESFGMRKWSSQDGQFTVNGKKTFLRGEANSAVFPQNGYPYMTKEEWITFFKKAQSMGINFFRFHSWTPPMAAFSAADELGIYMQPEMYGFGGAPSDEDFNETLYGEDGIRIVKYLASNPSFVMLTFGNEMTTTASQTAVENYRAKLKALDNTRLYAEGTNNNLSVSELNHNDDFWTTAKVGMENNYQHIRLSFGWNNDDGGGRLESEQPNSKQDYTRAMEYLDSDIPVMGHEVGQYQVLPNFDEEIAKYQNTVFAPRNLSTFKSTMNSKGILYMNEKFAKSTARTSAISYRADIEAALKTNNFGGYQLLSIQDFPGQNTALVGILDSFMDDKAGGFTSAEYKSFNSPVTTLAKIPKYIYTCADSFSAEIVTANYSENDITATATWEITDYNQNVIASGTMEKTLFSQGAVTSSGTLNLDAPFVNIKKAQKLIFKVGTQNSQNSYSIWVYPKDNVNVPNDVLVANAYTQEVRDTLNNGGKVVLLPRANKTDLPNSVSVRWTNDYWSSMFHGRVADASNTMGIYLNPDHPLFNDFPTEFFGDYQWYNLMKKSRAVVLDDAPAGFEPIVWNIDHMQYSKKLGSLFEAKVGEGKLLVCTMDILSQMDKYPEVAKMYGSLVEYASSNEFNPSQELSMDYLKTIFNQVNTSADEISAYGDISGFSHSWSQTKSALKSESGKDENGNSVTNSAGGISAGDMLRFDNLLFDETGSTTLRITGANGSSTGAAAVIDVYLDSENGQKLATLEFENTGGWKNFRMQEFSVPHLWGTQNILFKFTNANISFKGFTFIKSEEMYRNPYVMIDPSNTGTGAVEFESMGGEYEIEQLTAKISGAVRVNLKNCDFGFKGASQLVIGGCVLSQNGEANADIVYTLNGTEQREHIVFKTGEGEQFTLESGTTGGLTFWRNTIKLSSVIKGVRDIAIEFGEDTDMQFADLTFTGD